MGEQSKNIIDALQENILQIRKNLKLLCHELNELWNVGKLPEQSIFKQLVQKLTTESELTSADAFSITKMEVERQAIIFTRDNLK